MTPLWAHRITIIIITILLYESFITTTNKFERFIKAGTRKQTRLKSNKKVHTYYKTYKIAGKIVFVP